MWKKASEPRYDFKVFDTLDEAMTFKKDNEGYDEKTMSSSMVVDITPCDGKVLVKISRVNFTPVCM